MTYTLTGSGISGGSVTFNYPTNPSSYTLTGLSPATSYGPFTIAANNTSGTSGASNQVGVVSTILDAPTSLNFTSVSASEFILNWTASSGAGSYVLTNASLGGQTVSGTNATYSGLVANTNYGTITVTPFSGAGGTGTVGTAATSGTAGTAPNPPTSLSATATSSTTATVTFTGSVGGASSYTGGGGGSHNISGTTDTITGLSGSTSYTFTVFASGTFGNSTTASANQITTPSSALYAFTNATFTSGGATGRNGPILSAAKGGLSGTPTPSAWNTNTSFFNMSIQGIMLWTVPTTATYRVKAYGATGKNNNNFVGDGAIIQGDFSLTQGQIIFIAIGQQSVTASTQEWQGGSGGTFMAYGSSLATSIPLIVAGGGGTNRSTPSYNDIMRASTATSGKNGSGSAGGQNGNQAASGGHNVGGGGSAAGYYGNGYPATDTRFGSGLVGSQSFTNGCVGGDFIGGDGNTFDGGFGGGGPGGWGGSGGGGGYSGGGNCNNNLYSGGGGSFITSSATNVATSDGTFVRTGSEPTTAYSGGVTNLSAWWSGGQGKLEVTVL